MKRILIILISSFLTFSGFAQIAIPSTADDASAELKVYSPGNNTGVMIPMLTTSQMMSIASPATGLLVFDTDDNGLKYYDGSNWVYVAAYKQFVAASLPTAPNNYNGLVIYNTTTNQLNFFNGTGWKAFTLTGATLP